VLVNREEFFGDALVPLGVVFHFLVDALLWLVCVPTFLSNTDSNFVFL
jgi:hypothetical protein